MPGFLSDSAELRELELALTSVSLELCLFSDDHTHAESDETADFTECVFTGYAPIVINPADWTFTEGNAGTGTPAQAVLATKTFQSTADGQSENARGWFMREEISGVIRGAATFDGADGGDTGPFLVQSNGDTIDVNVTRQLSG